MINLALNKNRDLKAISANFYYGIEKNIKSKINKHSKFLNTFETASNHQLAKYLRANIKEIISSDLNTILSAHEYEFKVLFQKEYINDKPKKFSKFKIIINEIFDYESLSAKEAYSFTEALGINTCPYCNRNYITTIGNDRAKFVRADIDHFLPKYKYPYLRLSFYNLIPSCVTCNRNAKGRKETSLEKNIHPYIEGFGNDAKLIHKPKTYLDLIGKGNPEMDFIFSDNKRKVEKIKGNIRVFRLKEQYSTHTKELNQLLALKEAFTETYIDDLIARYPKLKLTKEEAYYYAFGSIYSEVGDESQPMSKFKRDILEHIEMISL
ncbi:hypothetical protein [Arenibacter sp. F20364]|uniref:HNH endonuclease n=1 Tax=Arenibacter sp. F20364 TaxID=2926415 RepID=UPI001FF469D3|nr:hypothetical protein [Arenibacter sp. F20364]MCK0190664.1 hypothetical protein [Arenibacter sp. F20364]